MHSAVLYSAVLYCSRKISAPLNSSENSNFMKLNQKCVRTIILRHKRGVGTALLAKQFKVTKRRIRQLLQEYRESGKTPKVVGSGRKPYAKHPDNLKDIVCQMYLKYRYGANYLASSLRNKGVRVANKKVHEILLKNKMAKPQPAKQKRRTPWVRYERSLSLSAVHMDWTTYRGKQCCVVLDDSSRKILSGIECDNATAQASISLVQQVLDEYGSIRRVQEVITDRGTQFYANKKNRKGEAQHSFGMFLEQEGIKHLLCRVKHPQTNGKVERWFQEYKKHRSHFKTFKEFIDWYNHRPHGSLDFDKPERVFWQRLQPYTLGRFVKWTRTN